MDTLKLIERIEIIQRISDYRQTKIYKKRTDPFSDRDRDFKKKYRFNKGTVFKIVELIKADIAVEYKGLGTSPELKVLVALRYWGRREYQGDAGELHGLSQPTASRVCARVSRVLHSLNFG